MVERSARVSARSLQLARGHQAPALSPAGNTAQSRGPFEKEHHWGNPRRPLSCIRADSGCKLTGQDAWRWQGQRNREGYSARLAQHCRADSLLDVPGSLSCPQGQASAPHLPQAAGGEVWQGLKAAARRGPGCSPRPAPPTCSDTHNALGTALGPSRHS